MSSEEEQSMDLSEADQDEAVRRPQAQQDNDAESGAVPASQASYRPQEKRLIITKMVLENFKSYAGKQEIGPLHHMFSAVVGPNGSGKSNVIDAVLFVFGRQAKKLRLNKVSEFIHNSEHHRNLTSAKVMVHFEEVFVDDDDSVSRPVPGSKFVLTRTAKADNTSDYFLDSKKVTRDAVVGLLKSKGVDLDNSRFLILQGEVEQISLMKPKGANPNEVGLVEYLEEIIGSNKYVDKIEEMTKSVDDLTEERRGKMARVDVAEKECKRLEGAKTEAESCIQKQRDLLDKQAIISQLHIIKESAKIESDRKKKRDAEAALQKHQEEMNATIEAARKLEIEWKKKNKEFEQLGEELAKAKQEWNQFEKKDIAIRSDMTSLENSIKECDANIKAATKTANESKNTHKQLLEDVQKIEQEKAQLEEKLRVAQKELDRLYNEIKETTRPLLERLESVKTDQIPHKRDLAEAQAKLGLAKKEHNMLSERSTTAQRQAEEAEQLIDTLTQQLATIAEDVAAKKQELVQKRAEMEQKSSKIPALEKEEFELGHKVMDLHGQKSDLESTSSATNANKIVEALLAAKAKGTLPGVYGRLGDLGCIDDKYDVAVSTACSALHNIVVDSADTGSKCVELLRKHNLGRTTFIILDKIMQREGKTMNQPFTAPSGSKRLFDLVDIKEPDVRAAFYFALRDTLVAESFEEARRIAFGTGKSWRVVTTDGDLFERSGTMSGGGTKKFSGYMRSQKNFVDPKEQAQKMKKVVAQLEELEKQREKARIDLLNYREDVGRLKREIGRLEDDIRKADYDTKSIKTQLDQNKRRLPELQAQGKLSSEEKARLQTLATDIAKLEKECEKINKLLSKSEEEIQQITKEIDDVGGTDLKVQKSRVASAQQQIQLLVNQQSSATQKASRAAKKATENEKQREEIEATRAAALKRLEKKDQELKVLVEKALVAFQAYEKAEAAYKEHDDAEMRQELDAAKAEVAELRRAEARLQDEFSKMKKLIDEREGRIEQNKKRVTIIQRDKLQTKIEDEEDETLAIPDVNEENMGDYDEAEITEQLQVLKQELQATEPDRAAIRAWRERKKVLEERQAELDEVSNKRDAAKKELEDLRKKRYEEFKAGFDIISTKLREMYRMITLGGDAELEVIDLMDPFSEGINFTVRPPGKSWKKIQNLSGGEKTLSSLSLVFALHYYKPTPIYIMDEIDAALDFKNVSIVANYIKERTKNAQFLIVSLRNYMFELADRLVGIYKTDNCTKSVTIDPHAFSVPAEPAK